MILESDPTQNWFFKPGPGPECGIGRKGLEKNKFCHTREKEVITKTIWIHNYPVCCIVVVVGLLHRWTDWQKRYTFHPCNTQSQCYINLNDWCYFWCIWPVFIHIRFDTSSSLFFFDDLYLSLSSSVVSVHFNSSFTSGSSLHVECLCNSNQTNNQLLDCLW